MPARTSVTVPAWRTASSNACPSVRNGSVSGSAAKAPSTATTAVGTSSRNRLPETANTTIADTASATPPPLLCVPSQRHAMAVAPPSASARIAACTSCRAASATAGQNATSAIAAWPFQYVTGKSSRPSKYRSSGSPFSRSHTAVQTAKRAEAEDDDDRCSQPIRCGAERDERRERGRRRRRGPAGRRRAPATGRVTRPPKAPSTAQIRRAAPRRRGAAAPGARQSPRRARRRARAPRAPRTRASGRRRSSPPCPRRARTRCPRGRRRERRAGARQALCDGCEAGSSPDTLEPSSERKPQ